MARTTVRSPRPECWSWNPAPRPWLHLRDRRRSSIRRPGSSGWSCQASSGVTESRWLSRRTPERGFAHHHLAMHSAREQPVHPTLSLMFDGPCCDAHPCNRRSRGHLRLGEYSACPRFTSQSPSRGGLCRSQRSASATSTSIATRPSRRSPQGPQGQAEKPACRAEASASWTVSSQ